MMPEKRNKSGGTETPCRVCCLKFQVPVVAPLMLWSCWKKMNLMISIPMNR